MAAPVNFNTLDRGMAAGLTDALSLTPSAQSNQVAYDQVNSPDAANYKNPGADAALGGYSVMAGGGGPAGAARGDQIAALGMARSLADGSGPSLSRANMNLGLSQGMSNLSSAAAGMGGGAQGGLGQRNLLNAMAGMQGQAAGQGAVAGAQEQIGNMKNYGALGSAMRGQDIQQTGIGLGGQLNAGNSVRDGNMAYDAARQSDGIRRAGLIKDASAPVSAAASQVWHGAGNAFSSVASAIPSGGDGGDGAPSGMDGAYHDPLDSNGSGMARSY